MNKINQEALAVKRAEQLFDRRRRTVGLFGGPLLALLVFLHADRRADARSA